MHPPRPPHDVECFEDDDGNEVELVVPLDADPAAGERVIGQIERGELS